MKTTILIMLCVALVLATIVVVSVRAMPQPESPLKTDDRFQLTYDRKTFDLRISILHDKLVGADYIVIRGISQDSGIGVMALQK